MKNIYRKLTKGQQERGVIFSSVLANDLSQYDEDMVHEVFEDTYKKELVIERLSKPDFFSEAYKYNIIRK